MVINMSVGNGLKFKMIPTIRNLFFTPGGDIHYIGGSEVLPPPLDPAQEAEVLKRLGTEREEEAKSILIEHNLRLVVYIAKKFENTGVGVEDLISIGTIGLIKAINTYNKEKNIKLATYASRCIENEILMYLRRNNKTKMEVSIDEPLNVDWDGNELLLSDILGTDSDVISKDIEDEIDRKMLNKAMETLSDMPPARRAPSTKCPAMALVPMIPIRMEKYTPLWQTEPCDELRRAWLCMIHLLIILIRRISTLHPAAYPPK